MTFLSQLKLDVIPIILSALRASLKGPEALFLVECTPSCRGKHWAMVYCTCLLSKLLSSTCYMTGTVTGTEDTAGNKLDLASALMKGSR